MEYLLINKSGNILKSGDLEFVQFWRNFFKKEVAPELGGVQTMIIKNTEAAKAKAARWIES